MHARRNQVALAAVPLGQDLGGRSAAENSRVDQAGEADARDVSASAVDAVKVPDGFGCPRVVLLEKTAAVVAVKDSGETPGGVIEWLDVGDVDDEEVARLGALDLKRAGEIVDLVQVHVPHILGAIVVSDLATSPVQTLDLDRLTGLNGPN